MTEDTDTLLTGFGREAPLMAMHVITAKDYSSIRFEVDEGFKKALSNKLRLSDGGTVGESHVKWMHERLDAWIKEKLK